MAEPSRSTCSPWATELDVCPPCNEYDFPLGLLDTTLQIASDLLFELSARQFPGLCSDKFRPCSQRIIYDGYPYRQSSFPYYQSWSPLTFGGGFGDGFSGGVSSCGCNTGLPSCGCGGLSELSLGVRPLVSIEEVKIDGVIIPASSYRIDDYKTLVRIDGERWPCCQNLRLADTELDTFSVSATFGVSPPAAGIHAAAILACELALACTPAAPGECRLPPKVQAVTRQGVSMVMLSPVELLQNGKTGIAEIDYFLVTYNPRGRRMSSAVFSPDVRSRARHVDT